MATAALTTVVDRGIGDPLTEPIWDDQLKDNINQLIGLRSRNLLTDGGFEVWQRGVGPFTSTGVYGPDRWLVATGGVGAASVTQETTTVDASTASAKVVVTVGTGPVLQQKLEDFTQLRGKTISCSLRAHQSVASRVRLDILTSVGGLTSSATSAVTGSFVTLTVTATIATTETNVTVQISFLGTGTFYVDNAMLVMGPAPTEYVPLHPQEELARCQRYYEVHGGFSGALALNSYGAAGGSIGMSIPFAVPKGGTPTVTKFGTFAVTNCGQPSVNSPGTTSYNLSTTVTALGTASFSCNSSDDLVEAIWNP